MREIVNAICWYLYTIFFIVEKEYMIEEKTGVLAKWRCYTRAVIFIRLRRFKKVNCWLKQFSWTLRLEAVGTLLVDLKSFGIKEAGWEIHRAPDPELLGRGVLPDLKGELRLISMPAGL